MSATVRNNLSVLPGKAAIWSDEYGLSWLAFEPGAEITAEDAKALLEMARKTHVEGEYFRVLIDLRSDPVLTTGARDFAAGEDPKQIISAFAVVANDLAMKLVGNFFIQFHKPDRPTKIFSDVGEAQRWLLRQKDKK